MLMFKPDAGHFRYETPILMRPKLPRLLRKTTTPSPVRSEEEKGGLSRCKKLTAKDFMRPMLLRATPVATSLYLDEVSPSYPQLYALKPKVSPQLHPYTGRSSRNRRDKRSLIEGGGLERYKQLLHTEESTATTTPGRLRRDSSSRPRQMMKIRQSSLESGLVVQGKEAQYAKAIHLRLKRRAVMESRGNQVDSRGDLVVGREAQTSQARMNLRLKRRAVMESRGNQADSRGELVSLRAEDHLSMFLTEGP